MTEGNKPPLSLTDTAESCISFVGNHHTKIDLGVPIQISPVIKRPENISFLLHRLEVIPSFCIRNSFSFWSTQCLSPKKQRFLHLLYSSPGMTKQRLSRNAVLPCRYSLLKNKACALHTAQFWRCQYSQGAISSPSNQQQLQLLSMLKLEQQAVGKMHEGHQCDSVQTSRFHRLSIHHHNSPWKHSGPKEQSCPPPYQHSLLLSHPGVTHRHWQLTGLFSTFSRCSYVQRCCPTRENCRFRTNRGSLVAACAGWAQRRRKGSTSLSSCNYSLFFFFYN